MLYPKGRITDQSLNADSAVHLSEELKDASYSLPRAMCAAALINYALGFITTITLMSNLGDISAALNDRSGQPWVAVIYEITGSKAATIVLIVVMIIMYFFCAVNQVTTSSRQVFAFARDKVGTTNVLPRLILTPCRACHAPPSSLK